MVIYDNRGVGLEGRAVVRTRTDTKIWRPLALSSKLGVPSGVTLLKLVRLTSKIFQGGARARAAY